MHKYSMFKMKLLKLMIKFQISLRTKQTSDLKNLACILNELATLLPNAPPRSVLAKFKNALPSHTSYISAIFPIDREIE